MDETPQQHDLPSTSDAFVQTVDHDQIPLEEARKLSRNYK